MILAEAAAPAPNLSNFFLLALAVWGAVTDNRYKAKGGKREVYGWWKFLAAIVLLVLLSVFMAYGGFDAGRAGFIMGNLVVWMFAVYELRRFFVRHANPHAAYQK